jgi:hypothetical protein
MVCYRRRQTATNRCRQRSYFVDGIEAQIGAYLATFSLPDDEVQRVVDLFEISQDQKNDAERRRREIQSRLERIAELYKWGDLTREAYQSERDKLQAELASIKGEANLADVLTKTAQFLRDLPTAWGNAGPAQRNDLARLVFRSLEIKDDRVIAVVVNSEFTPFFATWAKENTPTDGPGCQGSEESLEVAEVTGFESAISALTGQHVRPSTLAPSGPRLSTREFCRRSWRTVGVGSRGKPPSQT